MYEILLTSIAVKDYNKIPQKEVKKINKAIDELADDPRPHGYKKLKGRQGYRVRAGNYRIIYEINDKVLTVLVIRIRDRKEVYKK